MATQTESPLVKTVGDACLKAEASIASMGMSPDQFKRILLNALYTNPKIQDCSNASIQHASMRAAQDGLIPDGREAAFIPRKGVCSYEPMVFGLLKLARQAMPGISINSQAVFDGEGFEYEQGTTTSIIHRPLDAPADLVRNRGALVAVYCVIRHQGENTWPEIELMTANDIERHRQKYSKAHKSSWDDPDEYIPMAKKTVVLRSLKSLPRSGKFASAMASVENDEPIPDDPAPTDTAQPPATNTAEKPTTAKAPARAQANLKPNEQVVPVPF